ncbi:hypothetical protein BFJ68_g3473 [Fusarium oxysporum]|uniref:Uncharacterized protein n=1 Tax=Fusarium oxysporum TaxID=5507 RepID=A0A420RQB8_FUSOX|nr:hypothetical protein BFJ68_g3473 [Fusarium oxysporum]
MEASPITVAVVHTPYWNISDVAFLRDGPHNVLVPALLYLRASDIETTRSSPRSSHRPGERKRKRPHSSHGDSSEQPVHQSSRDSEAELSNSSPCSVGSDDSSCQHDRDPSNILHKLNMTEHERLLLHNLENEIRQDEYYGSARSTPSFTPASKRRRHDGEALRVREQKSPEEEKDEYERWVMAVHNRLNNPRGSPIAVRGAHLKSVTLIIDDVQEEHQTRALPRQDCKKDWVDFAELEGPNLEGDETTIHPNDIQDSQFIRLQWLKERKRNSQNKQR